MGRTYPFKETGHYASRPPGELHDPLKDVGCAVLEVSFPGRVVGGDVG